MIDGAHVVVYSKDADADRAFMREVLGLKATDVGGGWLVFALPPTEVAVHPFEKNDLHQLFFLCKDIKTFMAAMKERNVASTPVRTEQWGYVTQVALPGGGKISVYEPRHARASGSTSAARSRARPRPSRPTRRRSAAR